MKFRTLYLCLCMCLLAHFVQATIVDVKEFGATGDKSKSAQQAIQNAIDRCAGQGGGTVSFPAGDYLSGTIRLRSNITLQLSAGATIWASTDPGDYQAGSSRGRLLVAEDVKNISIIGEGTIHGQATGDYGARWGAPDVPEFRTGILLFERCKNVTIRDVWILYSDSWTVHLKRCEGVLIDGITIFNNIHRLNSDGIDPNSCRDVRISNCHIVAGDDCIVFKSTDAYPCEDIVVTNCTLETTTTAIKLGTESKGDFRDIHVSNCVVKNTRTGIGFFMKDGTVMERVSFNNISIENLKSDGKHDVFPIFMDIEKRHEDSPIGAIRDVSFRGIFIHGGSGILIQGMPESPIENLTLQDITIRADWLDDYSNRKKAVGGRRTTHDERDTRFARMPAYASLAYVKHLIVDNLRVFIDREVYKERERSALYGYELENVSLRGIYGDCHGSAKRTSIVTLENCRHGVLSGCIAPNTNTAFLRLLGEKTIRILVVGNELSSSSLLVNTDNRVLEGEYKVIGNYELMSRNDR